MRIIRPDGTDVGIGETGEIWVRADSTTSGCWEDAVATAELYRDGWLHSGDLGM